MSKADRYKDDSRARVSRFRLHENDDHSACKPPPEGGCVERETLETRCYYFFVAAMAANVPDDLIVTKANELFPDWLVDYTWPTSNEDDSNSIYEMDIGLIFNGVETPKVSNYVPTPPRDPGVLMRLESHYWDDSPILPEDDTDDDEAFEEALAEQSSPDDDA